MVSPTAVTALSAILAAWLLLSPARADDLTPSGTPLGDRFERIDDDLDGQLGVYVQRLSDGAEARHRVDRPWYLASTVKVPLAVVALRQVETGTLALDQRLTLTAADYVDGGGALLYAEPGTVFSLRNLLERMIRDSDNTATDMVIRLVGEENANARMRALIPDRPLNPVTTLLQVRQDAYGTIHDDVANLTNWDFIEIRAAGEEPRRYQVLMDKLAISADQAQLPSVRDAFERYYEEGLNSGRLDTLGAWLHQLAEGNLLNREHTALLLGFMSDLNTGKNRIQAGLPKGTPFAHKTGTQIARACDAGLIYPTDPERAVVVVTCAEGFNDLDDAEAAFRRVGESLAGVSIGPDK